MLNGDFGADRSVAQTEHEHLWRTVGAALSGGYAPALQALVTLTRRHTQQLLQQAQDIDIAQEIKKLKFEYGSGGRLVDASSDPSLVQSVHQLLQETQQQHIQSFAQTEKWRNACHERRGHKQQLQRSVRAALAQTAGTQQQAAYSLFEAELGLVGQRAGLACVTRQAAELRERMKRVAEERSALQEKHRHIQQFSSTVERKQGVIQVLIKQNNSARARIEEQQGDVQRFAEESVVPLQRSLQMPSCESRLVLVAGVRRLWQLLPLLPRLQLSDGTRSLLELSINSVFEPPSGLQCSALRELMLLSQRMDVPVYEGSECVLPRLLHLYRERVRHQGQSHAASLGQSVLRLQERCREVSRRDAALEAQLLPVLQQRLDKAQLALNDSARLSQLIQHWWDQPAQNLVPWITCEDKNLEQWRAEWNAALNALRHARNL